MAGDYFAWKLISYNVGCKMLEIFDQPVVAGALVFSVVCWGGSISARDATRRLKKLMKKALVIGCR